MEADSCVPPGFRFHPTEEELVGYYLARKVASQKIDVEVIADIDLYKIEPWDLQDSCKLGYEEQTEWYFFSHKDKKYPSGTRTNRATIAGFWKATGRDKAVFSKRKLIGMRKTLVFYKGRAPNGRKTDWIMHEYRLETSEHAPPQDEGWVVCRAFRKRNPHPRPSIEPWDHARYLGDNTQAMYRAFSLDFAGPKELADSYQRGNFPEPEFDYKSKVDIEQNHSNQFLHLPQLNSTAIPTLLVTRDGFEADVVTNEEKEQRNNFGTQLADWRELDMLLASQLNETPCSTSISPLLYLGTEDLTQNQLNGFLTSLPNS